MTLSVADERSTVTTRTAIRHTTTARTPAPHRAGRDGCRMRPQGGRRWLDDRRIQLAPGCGVCNTAWQARTDRRRRRRHFAQQTIRHSNSPKRLRAPHRPDEARRPSMSETAKPAAAWLTRGPLTRTPQNVACGFSARRSPCPCAITRGHLVFRSARPGAATQMASQFH